MAARTRTTNRVSETPEVETFKSKSDHIRSLLKGGMNVADAARTVGIGYPFAYGVAQRAGLAEKAATRRAPANAKVTALIRWMEPKASDRRIAALVAAFVAGEAKPGSAPKAK